MWVLQSFSVCKKKDNFYNQSFCSDTYHAPNFHNDSIANLIRLFFGSRNTLWCNHFAAIHTIHLTFIVIQLQIWFVYFFLKSQYWLICLPGLKRAIALRQANSAGSTCKFLNLVVISCSILISDTVLDAFPFARFCEWSGVANNGDVSMGMLHWIAQRRNNSAHDSSNNMTCK